VFNECGGSDKFVNNKIVVKNNKVLLKTALKIALKTMPNDDVYINIDEIFKFNIIESIKLKINNNITNELYRLLFSKHNSYIILLGINYKIKGNLIL